MGNNFWLVFVLVSLSATVLIVASLLLGACASDCSTAETSGQHFRSGKKHIFSKPPDSSDVNFQASY